jgi:hypothetical protein
MKLIGIMGRAGAGKDSVASMIAQMYNYQIYHFADPLKKACSAAFGISLDHFHDRHLKEEVNEYWNMSPREMAQLVGTECFRDQIDPNFWIMRAYLEYRAAIASGFPGFIIADVRFQNEADMIFKNGGFLIEVLRPNLEEVGVKNHRSEAGINAGSYKERVYHIINDGTISQLQAAVKTAVTRI